MPSEKQIEAFARYRRKQIAELRPYIEGEDVSHVSISPEDAKAGSPKCGDMIARNPKNHADQWLVARAYFLDNFEALTAAEQAEPAPAADAPLGAIENGRVFLQRLVDHYDFQCEAGGLANCSDYHEAVRCFEAMAEWIYHHAPAARSGAMNEKAVMVCPQCEGEGEYADGLDEAACSTPCTRCDGNGWIVDFSAIEQAEPAATWVSFHGKCASCSAPIVIESTIPPAALEPAEPAPAQCKHPVWGQDKDGTRVCAKCGLVEHPAARSGAVKVKALEWESIDGGNAFRAPALIFGWIRIETYTLHSWQVQWSVPGICNLLMPNVFDSPSAAKAAAQADYERRILSALEPAEQATDTEPVRQWPQFIYDSEGEPSTRPPESRLREALEFYADSENWKQNGPLDPNSGNFTGGPARAALAQEDGR